MVDPMPKDVPIPRPVQRALAPVRALFVGDSAGGVLLILVAAAAMLVANTALYEPYHALFHDYLWPHEFFKLNTLHLWVNDGLMAIFFFVVGLEVKREIVCGQLSSPDQRRLPVMAAMAGMAAPAAIYLTIALLESPGLTRGWAIPAATDIAFAMGVLGLLGSRVPSALRLFLLTVAIVDDIGAVLIIALFYTSNLDTMWLVIALAIFGCMIAMNRFGVPRTWPFAIMALLLWLAVLFSGVHATIAGVLAALTFPMGSNLPAGQSMLEKAEHTLAPWSAYFVVPVFGFANAGVNLTDMDPSHFYAPLPLAIAAGLVLGKQLGIFTIILVAVKLGIAPKPERSSWPEIWGVSILCGIGFTMSIFINGLAFAGSDELIDEAKIGILGGSIISAIIGYVVLRLTTKHPEDERDADSGTSAI